MLIDTHCHLWHQQFKPDLEKVIEEAEGPIICVGTNLDDSAEGIKIAQKHPNVYVSVGIYPDENTGSGDFRAKLIDLAKSNKVVAIGECGLDYSEGIKRQHDEQKELFRKQVGAAIQLGLPLMIHNRGADSEILEELNHYKETGRLKGVFHCFVGDVDFAERVLNLGFYISFTGIITFPNAKELAKTVEFVPLEKILLETDAPYLAPQAHRGERNEPKYVRIIASRIADIKGKTLDEVAEITSQNTRDLFNLK